MNRVDQKLNLNKTVISSACSLSSSSELHGWFTFFEEVYVYMLIRLLLLTSISTVFCRLQSYRNYKLYHIDAGEEIAPLLEQLEADGVAFDEVTGNRRTLVDVWAEPHKKRSFAHVMVAPEFEDTLTSLLDSEGFAGSYRVIKGDIQKEIDATKWRQSRRRTKRRIESVADFKVHSFHNYDHIEHFLELLAAEYPDIATVFHVGNTFEGRQLTGIKIGSKLRRRKPSVFIDAGIHAREWIAPAAALYHIHKLVTEYGTNTRVSGLVDKFDWYIIPVANPDGYVYSFEKDRLWRKTRSRNVTINKWCVGTDANRNWGGRGWGEIGANRSPCSNIYAGQTPFSEPEVLGMKEFIEKNVTDLKVYISLHSYGQLFLSPWGYTSDKPANHDDQREAARLAVEAIKDATGRVYQHGTIAEIMYPASGTSIDYMQDLGVPYIYGIELRPEDMEDSYGFTVPKEQIEPTGKELFAALASMADYVVEHRVF
uniref:Peptidase_M14 domain-containing protein n=1 Tax=Panagrellus redivivus TaxID=6233 RepID=A0A7E4ULA9_PANRE